MDCCDPVGYQAFFNGKEAQGNLAGYLEGRLNEIAMISFFYQVVSARLPFNMEPDGKHPGVARTHSGPSKLELKRNKDRDTSPRPTRDVHETCTKC